MLGLDEQGLTHELMEEVEDSEVATFDPAELGQDDVYGDVVGVEGRHHL